METKVERSFGESKLLGFPHKKINLTIADDSISTSMLKDGCVTPNKLSDEVYNLFHSIEQGGLALTGELGNSTVLGIHQKKLTELFLDIFEQLQSAQESTNSIMYLGQFLELDEETAELFLKLTSNDIGLIGDSMFYVDLNTMELMFSGEIVDGIMGVDDDGMLYIMN